MALGKNHSLLAHYLRDARIARGLSQLQVSERLNYTGPQFISNWERGLSPVPLPTLKQLIGLYQLNKTELIEVLLEEEKIFLSKALR